MSAVLRIPIKGSETFHEVRLDQSSLTAFTCAALKSHVQGGGKDYIRDVIKLLMQRLKAATDWLVSTLCVTSFFQCWTYTVQPLDCKLATLLL